MERGLAVSVHSDDPAYFGGYLTENLLSVTKQLDLSTEQVATLLRNAIEASFAPPQRRTELQKEHQAMTDTNCP